ncbi:MAG TPA: hypothetical protein VGR93_10485 [Candidatus Acidoferrales bacterium]|nr:hypothetical protein [Candidatus Acidoferrales bacterium]
MAGTRSGGTAGFGDIETLGGAPQTLNIIEQARLFAEDVDHEAAVIEKEPFGSRTAFTMRKAESAVAEFFFDLLANGFDLPSAFRRTNDEILGKGAESFERQHSYGTGFFALSCFNRAAYRIG